MIYTFKVALARLEKLRFSCCMPPSFIIHALLADWRAYMQSESLSMPISTNVRSQLTC